jgi:hypothetical protein
MNYCSVILSERKVGQRTVVGTDACCLPAGVNARGIRVVQLELVVRVIASVQEGHAERTQA